MLTELKHIIAVFFITLLLIIPLSASAAGRLVVQVTPEQDDLKKNIQAYLSQLVEGDATSLNALKRTVEQQTRLASEALGYYQTNIIVRVTEEAEPRLQVLVESGDPVRLRSVTIKVEGEAAGLLRLPCPMISDLRWAHVLITVRMMM